MNTTEEAIPFRLYPHCSRIPLVSNTFSLTIRSSSGRSLPTTLALSVMHLDTLVVEETLVLEEGSSSYTHEVSLEGISIPSGDTGMGFGIEVSSDTHTASTAIDIGDGLLRYGFVSDFKTADLLRVDRVVEHMVRNHITHVQFYDWAYRPHQFGPPVISAHYEDTMGKPIDFTVVKALIEGFRTHHIKSLGYGAVYAATNEYLDEHPEEALYDIEGNTFDLIDKFFIMDLDDQGWRENIIKQYTYAVDTVGFDGLHMDTYGYPKTGWGYDQEHSHSLEASFVSFIDEWGSHGHENIFNNVGGWPARSTASADQAACYIEVWEPHRKYHQLRTMIGEVLPFRKPVILAAYLEPFKIRDEKNDLFHSGPIRAAKLLTAVVSSLGATSLLLGEDGVVLTQPYYSDYTRLTEAEAEILRKYYDFQVRYRELLFDPSLVDITESHALGENREFTIAAGEYPVSHDGEAGTSWGVVRRAKTRIVMHLINLLGQSDDRWNETKSPCSTRPPITLRIPRFSHDMRIYTASPEESCGKASLLSCRNVEGVRGPSISVELEQVGLCVNVNQFFHR